MAAISRAGFLELAGLRPLFGARFSLVQELQAISKMIDTSYASVHEDLGSLCSGARYCGHLVAANASSMSEIPL